MGFSQADLESFKTDVEAIYTTDCKTTKVKFKAQFKRPSKEQVKEFQRNAVVSESPNTEVGERLDAIDAMQALPAKCLIDVFGLPEDVDSDAFISSHEAITALSAAFSNAIFPSVRGKNS